MTVSIDPAGRVVLPKAIREQLRLTPGTALDVSVRDGTVVLEPAPTPMRLVRRGKGVVAEPEEDLPPLSADLVRDVIEAHRR
jgi:AbrB family looped-hinge helix DNA binding protein